MGGMIAYEGNNDLSFDTEVFDRAAKVYREKSEQLGMIKNDLLNMIEQLKDGGWKSAAGKAFYGNLHANWADDIQRYADLMETLAECIEEASRAYEDLKNEAAALKIDTGSF